MRHTGFAFLITASATSYASAAENNLWVKDFVAELSLSLARLRGLHLRNLTSRCSRSACHSYASVWKKRAHAGQNEVVNYSSIFGMYVNRNRNWIVGPISMNTPKFLRCTEYYELCITFAYATPTLFLVLVCEFCGVCEAWCAPYSPKATYVAVLPHGMAEHRQGFAAARFQGTNTAFGEIHRRVQHVVTLRERFESEKIKYLQNSQSEKVTFPSTCVNSVWRVRFLYARVQSRSKTTNECSRREYLIVLN